MTEDDSWEFMLWQEKNWMPNAYEISSAHVMHPLTQDYYKNK